MRLNLGCRDDILEGWENIDLYYPYELVQPLDIRTLDYPKGSVQEIRAHSILEHLTFAEGEAALNLWLSFLCPGGTISLITPDFDTLYDTGVRLGIKHIAAQIYGDHREEGQAHKSCWQKKNIIEIFQNHDVAVIEDKRWLDDMWLIGKKHD